jgi:arsenite-transporting ATPase
MTLAAAFESLRARQVVLVGGKGGVGKTTIACAAALHSSRETETILFTTDPASNLEDLFGPMRSRPLLRVESLDAGALWQRFLDQHLPSFLEIGDRGTFLDRDELRRLFELAIPGVDELMAWLHIGELAEELPGRRVIVDTAPTGHTLRMLSGGQHFAQLATALDAMQEKHRALVYQFTRRSVPDAQDAFIDAFEAAARRRRELLGDPLRCAFLPVTLAEPLVLEQTARLIAEVTAGGLDVPLVILNRARGGELGLRDRFAPREVVDAPRACMPLDSAERIGAWLTDDLIPPPSPASSTTTHRPALSLPRRPIVFLAGKGGVGKTSCSASIAIQLAARDPQGRFVVLSVDPAHSLLDLFGDLDAPQNLSIEAIDTRAKWRRFRESLGDEIAGALDALTPQGISMPHESEAMRQLLAVAPPGADELFAIIRLAELMTDESLAGVIVDTAPTGHFLRLLELPQTAGEWVREFMRLLLRYRNVIPPGSLAEELVRASRSLKEVEAAFHSDRTAVVVVTRPERIVVAETRRLLAQLAQRGLRIGGIIANAVTPPADDPCDTSMRSFELAELAGLPDAVVVERRATVPATLEDLRTLVPIEG